MTTTSSIVVDGSAGGTGRLGERALVEEVRRLRSRGRSPKEIARILGVRPAVVVPMVRAVARAEDASRKNDVDGDLVGCWVNDGWDEALVVEGHPEWPRGGQGRGCAGLASVTVARDRSGKVSVCVFLVDTHCLGLKDTIGPRLMSRSGLRRFLEMEYESFGGRYVEVPLELARQLVFGAIDFARDLGFQPHWELAPCAPHLGMWGGNCAIRFGRFGKPMYVSGPYDDVGRTLETLERSVGPDGYDFICGMELSEAFE